ncbi:MAG: hypothetical protein JRC69_07185 [Deltaproteobacteria bacterium]|nr:hypothetical protein [Deltaproteobacteria bacterium]
MKRLIVLICVLGGLLSSGLALGAGEFSWPMLVAPTAGSDQVQNRIKTESLDGCWAFKYTIASEWTTNFCLNKSTIEEYETDVFSIDGLDEYGNIAVGSYYSEGGLYFVMVTGSLFWDFFTFDFTSPATVQGCYYIFDPADDSLSTCFDMTGNRTSKTVTEKSAPTDKEHSNLLKHNEINEFPGDKAKSIVDQNVLGGISALKASIDKIHSSADNQ